jgi:hypothetical protein
VARRRNVQDRAYKFTTVESPVGPLELVAREYGLCATSWERDDSNRVRIGVAKQEEDGPHLRGAKTQIGAYGAGRRRAFDRRHVHVGILARGSTRGRKASRAQPAVVR